MPFDSMRTEGIEPPRPFGHEHLKLARLPSSATSAGTCDSRIQLRGQWPNGKAPVSKTGDSRFESWLPRLPAED